LKYVKTSFEKLNLFRLYYVPAWSVIYWLIQSDTGGSGLTQVDIKNAKAAHFLAMFLHALDDHLTDHQVPATHLTLLLRSQAMGWDPESGRAQESTLEKLGLTQLIKLHG
jgi:hypothetical protein